MSKEVYDEIASGLRDAIAIVNGELEPTRRATPADLDVKGIRRRTKLTQDAFAHEFGFTVKQIKDWEQGRTHPLGGVRAYLRLIDKDHKAIRALAAR
jgi:putative transcriptional regulator